MTDTDKLKRLAEDKRLGGEYMSVAKTDILALIAENERLSGALKAANDGFEEHERLMYLARDERDEAVSILTEFRAFAGSGSKFIYPLGVLFRIQKLFEKIGRS